MSDNENRRFNRLRSGGSRSRGQIFLVFLVAAVLIISVAAVALAEDSPLRAGEPEGTKAVYSAEELQYRRILQGISMSPDAVTGGLGCLDTVTNKTNNCTANDVRLGEVSNIDIKDPCDGLPDIDNTDYITFSADFQVVSGAQTRYDIGLWINTDQTGSAKTGTICSAASFTPKPDGPAEQVDGDACGDIKESVGPVAETFLFSAQCDALDDGVFDLPYCTTWDINTAGTCNVPLDTQPSEKSKCRCDDFYQLNNELMLEKTSIPAVITESVKFPKYDYQLVISNNGPLTATQIIITDTLPPEVSYTGAPINYIYSTGETGTCAHDTSPTDGVVTCDNHPSNSPWLPDLIYDGKITVTIEVEIADFPVLPNTEIYNYACVTWYGEVDDDDDPLTPPVPTRLDDCDDDTQEVAVTLSYFNASSDGATTTFDWTTSSETANAGFNIYAIVDGQRVKVNDELILSDAVDSSGPQNYSVSFAGVEGTSFYIEDVPARGAKRLHGPFTVAEAYGVRQEVRPIDWPAIRSEHAALAEQREAVTGAAAIAKMEASKPASPLAELMVWAEGMIDQALGKKAKPPLAKRIAYPAFYLEIDTNGLYRVTYEDMVAATGAGLAGAPAADLTLVDRNGFAVPISVGGGNIFGPDSYVEFYGEALDTLYTDANVLKLSVDAEKAERIAADAVNVPRNGEPAAYYMESAAFEGNNRYSTLTNTGNDPWYDTLLLAQTPKTWTFNNLLVDNYVPGGDQSMVTLELWGVNDVNHHVWVKVNNKPAGDLFFENQDGIDYAGPVALQEGANKLVLGVNNDQGGEVDMSRLEAYGLTYPRAFVARDGRLSFSGADDIFAVQNMASDDVVVYRLQDGVWQKLTTLKTNADTVRFAGSEVNADYHVSAVEALLKPGVSLAVTPDGLLDGNADLLIISHPSFIEGLDPLVKARQAQQYKVKVVNVEEVYAGYSGGVFDPLAIKAYIRDAIRAMGVEYVLLVGGDTTDYRGYSSAGMSFIPSLYAKTTATVNYAPVDPLYTDLNHDNVPDAAIGRFPVRTVAELDLMIQKTLQYEDKDYDGSAIFAADDGFSGYSEEFADSLDSGWSIEKAYMRYDGKEAARTKLIDALNGGVAVANFVGHSGRNNWTFDGLLSTTDVATLTNYDRPAMVSQWGCWNTYYVDPEYDTLGHVFLLSGSNGAAAVTGSTTLTYMNSEYRLGRLLMPRLVQPGMTIGQAMQDAKAELAQTHPDLVDVLLGWTILGDPTAVVQR